MMNALLRLMFKYSTDSTIMIILQHIFCIVFVILSLCLSKHSHLLNAFFIPAANCVCGSWGGYTAFTLFIHLSVSTFVHNILVFASQLAQEFHILHKCIYIRCCFCKKKK